MVRTCRSTAGSTASRTGLLHDLHVSVSEAKAVEKTLAERHGGPAA